MRRYRSHIAMVFAPVLLAALLFLPVPQAEAAFGDFLYILGYGQLYLPTGVAVSGNGNVYVAEGRHWSQQRIQAFDSDGNFITSWGGGGAGDGQFNFGYKIGMVTDSTGRLYVVDTWNHRIQVFDSTGNFLFKWGSNGSGDGQFYAPADIAIDASENIYVVDRNHRVQVFDSSGNFLFKWGSYGAGNENLRHPGSIAVGPNGNVHVFNWYGVKTFTNDGTFIRNLFSRSAIDVAVDANNNLYALNLAYDWIAVYDPNGSLIKSWGSTGYEPGQFKYPYKVALGTDGKIFVADKDNHRIQVFEGLVPPNQAPTANAGPDISAECTSAFGAVVSLNGSGSSDPDGDALTYTWNAQDGTVLATGATPAVSLSLDTHVITLTVDDGNGETSTDTVTVTVADTTAPVITITGITSGATYEFGLVPVAGYEVSDVCSTSIQVTEDLTGGDSQGLGLFTFTVTATDESGNTATKAATYTVIATQAGMTAYINDLVASGVMPVQTANNLLNMLNNAKLEAFINRLEALIRFLQTPKQIADSQAMLGAAETLIHHTQYMLANP